MNVVKSDLRQSGQLFYEKVMKEMTDKYIKGIQSNDREDLAGWTEHFAHLSEEDLDYTDLNGMSDWSSAQCIQVIRASNLFGPVAELENLLVHASADTRPMSGDELESRILRIARSAVVGALQARLMELGIEPSRIDDYVDWRQSGEYDNDRCRAVFNDCVINGKKVPSPTPSAVVA